MSSDSELSTFFESSTDDEDIDVVCSQYTTYLIAISLSCPQHYAIRAQLFKGWITLSTG